MNDSNRKLIMINSVFKKFDIGHKDKKSILSKITNFFSGRESRKKIDVISDISFDIGKGEVVGLIGRNGSGKSTLLRLIAEIYTPDSGLIICDGKIMYINGLNHGIKQRLTMKENVFLSGSIMGLSRNEVQNQFNNIVEFSGLGNFVNTKIYQFSSGMVTRLNFSIFIHFMLIKKPEILLIDEIFGVGGDLDFNRKAESKMTEFIKSGVTVIITGHQLNDIQKYCSRVLWIENGVLIEDGAPNIVIGKYRLSKK